MTKVNNKLPNGKWPVGINPAEANRLLSAVVGLLKDVNPKQYHDLNEKKFIGMATFDVMMDIRNKYVKRQDELKAQQESGEKDGVTDNQSDSSEGLGDESPTTTALADEGETSSEAADSEAAE